MRKYFKTFALLLLVASASMVVLAACTEKEDSNTSTNTNTTVDNSPAVADTEWDWRTEDPDHATGMLDVSVEFNGPKLASLIYTDFSTGILETDVLLGTYSYSGGRGTMTLDDDSNNTTVSVPFSVSDTTMTITFRNVTYNLTKRQ